VWPLIALAVAIMVGAGLATARHARRPRPPSPPHVHAVVRDDAPPMLTVQETPSPGEVRHVLRVQSRSGAATVTIEEVHDDHTAI
jgi:hypothetical protein